MLLKIGEWLTLSTSITTKVSHANNLDPD